MPDDAIVKPVVTPNTPRLGPVAVLVSSQGDIRLLDQLLDLGKDQYRPLFMSRLYPDPAGITGFSITGPVVGAPYAVMLLETLIAWGAKKFIFFGWCGAVSQAVKIGDVIVPAGAVIDEGTSSHYGADSGRIVEPAEVVAAQIKTVLADRGVAYHEGMVWSTDAIYRETPAKVQYFRRKGALAVEMELSALFTVGRYHNVDIGALLVVSDELSDFKWLPGFKDERFNRCRKMLCHIIPVLCQNV